VVNHCDIRWMATRNTYERQEVGGRVHWCLNHVSDKRRLGGSKLTQCCAGCAPISSSGVLSGFDWISMKLAHQHGILRAIPLGNAGGAGKPNGRRSLDSSSMYLTTPGMVAVYSVVGPSAVLYMAVVVFAMEDQEKIKQY
jgi:hypothetical protein